MAEEKRDPLRGSSGGLPVTKEALGPVQSSPPVVYTGTMQNTDTILPPAEDTPTERESITSLLASEAKERARLASKPVLDALEDAVELDDAGVPTFTVAPGDKVVIERYATILRGSPWLDTKVYTVESIDGVTGTLRLWDDEEKCHAMTNYITGFAAGFKFKVPPAKGGVPTSQRRRGRPRKIIPPGQEKPSTPSLDADGQPVKKKRGRPPGVKNRPRDVIVAERRAKVATKSTKRSKG
jgi:hypothetical protein